MNRIKKEFRKRGFKLNSDYEYLPFYIKGNSFKDPGYIVLEDVHVISAEARLVRAFNTGFDIYTMQRDGSLLFDFDD